MDALHRDEVSLVQPESKVESALSVRHLSKRFGDRVAFDDVCFEVARGEVFGFLGPNGAGKTTSVRTLATLLAPTSGSAVVAGIRLDPANNAQIRRRIAIMPESPGLYLRLSVLENLRCFADLYEIGDPSGRIGHALRAVNLTGRVHDLCGGLSKGCASEWRWPGPCWPTRRCSFSTNRPPAWTRSPHVRSTS